MRTGKKQADQLSGAVFLIGLGILFFTGFWWPGILMLIGVTGLVSGLGEGRGWSGLQAAIWMIGMGVLFMTDWFWPGLLIVIGLSMFLGYLQKPDVSQWWQDEDHGAGRDDDDEGFASGAWAPQAEPAAVMPPPIPETAPDGSDAYRARLKRAEVYRAGMEDLIKAQVGPKRAMLTNAAAEVDRAIEAIQTLGQRMQTIEANPLLSEDLKRVPEDIKRLETRLTETEDPSIRAELERALESKHTQLQSLQQLDNLKTRADIQIDNLLTSIGTTYTQMQLIDASQMDSARSQLLLDDVSEQVAKTQDVIYAMEEVYQTSTR